MELKLKPDKKTVLKRILFDAVIPALILALAVLADRLTKLYFETNYELGETKGEIIDGFFRFRLAHNTGAAFSFAADTSWGQTFFKILTPVAILGFIAFYVFNGRKNAVSKYALVFIIAGTLGNYIDRLAQGYVIDFLSFTLFFGYNFPIFNFADSFLCVGVIILFVYYIFFDKTIMSEEKPVTDTPASAMSPCKVFGAGLSFEQENGNGVIEKQNNADKISDTGLLKKSETSENVNADGEETLADNLSKKSSGGLSGDFNMGGNINE